MPRKPKTADKREVLAYLTAVIRGEKDINGAQLQAADRLGRYLGLWDGSGKEPPKPPVIWGVDQLEP